MEQHNHAVVWIDHREARIFHFNADNLDKIVVRAHNPHIHIHHKANAIGSGRAPDDLAFLHEVMDAMGAAKAILVTGPGKAKTELTKYVAKHDPAKSKAIIGVEPADQPTDGMLLAHAKQYFKAADHMSPQKKDRT